jgi:hypothetical protein
MSGSEKLCATFLALVAKVAKPTAGKVSGLASNSAVMLPGVPVDYPDITVAQTLMLGGASKNMAINLATILELDPDAYHGRLTHGQASVLALASALLRDPEVVVCMKPFAHVFPHRRKRIEQLLRVWQKHGGAETICRLLSGQDLEQGGVVGQVEQATKMRTVVLTSDYVEHGEDDFILHLDPMLEGAVVHAFYDLPVNLNLNPTKGKTHSPTINGVHPAGKFSPGSIGLRSENGHDSINCSDVIMRAAAALSLEGPESHSRSIAAAISEATLEAQARYSRSKADSSPVLGPREDSIAPMSDNGEQANGRHVLSSPRSNAGSPRPAYVDEPVGEFQI